MSVAGCTTGTDRQNTPVSTPTPRDCEPQQIVLDEFEISAGSTETWQIETTMLDVLVIQAMEIETTRPSIEVIDPEGDSILEISREEIIEETIQVEKDGVHEIVLENKALLRTGIMALRIEHRCDQDGEFLDLEDVLREEPPATPTPEPQADLELVSSEVSKKEIEPGDSIEIVVEVTNSGDARGIFQASLQLNGSVYDQKEISIDPGETVEINFSHTFDDEGEYEVSVSSNFIENITVEDPSMSVDEWMFLVENVLEDEMGFDIDSIEYRADTVFIEYYHFPDDLTHEAGSILGGYTYGLDSGMDPINIEATKYDHIGPVWTIHIKSEWGEGYIDGELDTSDLIENVLGNIQYHI